MERYINADELQAKINGISDYLDALSQLELVCEAIAEAPTADVREVKRGHWVKLPGFVTPGGDPVWGCSECGKGVHVYGIEANTYGADVADHQWVSCPNCGAIMDEWSIDSLMTQHHENYAKAGCEPVKRTDYDPFK